jgi:hypothetical protein
MNKWKAPFGGSNNQQTKDDVKSQNTSPEVVEKEKEQTITITPADLEAYLDKKLEEKLKSVNTQSPVIERASVKIKNENFDEIPELRGFTPKERIYVLTNGIKPISHGLQTRHKDKSPLQYINPETNETHALFFSYTETSFFKDKHKGDAKVEHVNFKEGMLKTYEDDIKLQKFLEIHPHNKANGGGLFELYDPAKEAEVKITDFEINLQALNLANDLSHLKRDAIAGLLCSDYSERWSPSELKQAVFVEAQKQPKNFLKLANDPTLEMKGVAKTALRRGIIEYRNYKFYNDKGDLICQVPPNQNEMDAIVNYFATGEGRNTFEYLRNAVG